MKRAIVNGDYFFSAEYDSDGKVKEAVIFGPNYHQSGYGLHSAGIFAVAMRNFPEKEFEETFPFEEVKNLYLSVLAKKNSSLETLFENLLGENFWKDLSYHVSNFSRDYYREIVAEPLRKKIPYEEVSTYENNALLPDYWKSRFPEWADEFKEKLSKTSSYKEFRQAINDFMSKKKEEIRETAEDKERIALAKEIAEKYPLYWALNQLYIYSPEEVEGLTEGNDRAYEELLFYLSLSLSEGSSLEVKTYREGSNHTIGVPVGPVKVEEWNRIGSFEDLKELLENFRKSLKEAEELISEPSYAFSLGKIREKVEKSLEELPSVEEFLSEGESEEMNL